MSLIPCTDPCIYQKDGFCQLSRAVSAGKPFHKSSCVYFLPNSKDSQNASQGFTNIPHLDHM